MKKIYYIILCLITTFSCMSCNDEWKDEQYQQLASFKANVDAQGVTEAYVRYKAGGTVTYNVPVLLSGSTMNSTNRTIHIGLDPDTLSVLNREQYGHREELYFRQLGESYYSFPETVDMKAGQCEVMLPIQFSLDNLDQSDKWVLPLQIMYDRSYNYDVNPRKYYRRAMLKITPFNDYSGTYDASGYKIYIDPDNSNAFTIGTTKAYVVDENTVFIYAGSRDVDYTDRKNYKIFIQFTDEVNDIQTKKLKVWTDNPELGLKIPDGFQPSYSVNSRMDDIQPYLKKIVISLNLNYSFNDYTTVPGQIIKYNVNGSLTMERKLNTLIPDEDQQIQW